MSLQVQERGCHSLVEISQQRKAHEPAAGSNTFHFQSSKFSSSTAAGSLSSGDTDLRPAGSLTSEGIVALRSVGVTSLFRKGTVALRSVGVGSLFSKGTVALRSVGVGSLSIEDIDLLPVDSLSSEDIDLRPVDVDIRVLRPPASLTENDKNDGQKLVLR